MRDRIILTCAFLALLVAVWCARSSCLIYEFPDIFSSVGYSGIATGQYNNAVLWWQFTNDLRNITDDSGSNNTAHVYGYPSWSETESAMYFESLPASSADRLYTDTTAGNQIGTSTTLTMCAWVKAPAQTLSPAGIFSIGLTNGTYTMLLALAGGTTLNAYVGGLSLTPWPYTSTSWHHLAMTYNGNAFRLYVDGTNVVSQGYSTALNSTGLRLLVAGYTDANTMTGYIEDFRCYKRTLTGAELTTLAQSSRLSTPIDAVSTSALLAYYPLNRQSQIEAVDNSVKAHDGIVGSSAITFGANCFRAANGIGTMWAKSEGGTNVYPSQMIGVTQAVLRTWIKVYSNEAGYGSILSNYKDATNFWGLSIQSYNDANYGLYFYNYHDAGGFAFAHTPYLDIDVWHHVVATMNGTNCAIWVDATNQPVTFPGGPINRSMHSPKPPISTFVAGWNTSFSHWKFDGYIGHTLLLTGTWTAAEITNDYLRDKASY